MLNNSLTRYIWVHTRKEQIWILLVVLLSMIPYYMSLSLPKDIVNGPIQGQGFETPGATQLLMPISVGLPYWGTVQIFPGIPLERLPMLWGLSAVYLLLVVVNGLIKYYINAFKGKLGERLLRRIRFTLVDLVLRFPPAAFKRVKAAEISSMVKDEVEPLGGFTGDAFVSPLLLGGQALTALIFIFAQSTPLGVMTMLFVAAQVLIIPRMRRRLLILGRERQLTARELSGRVGEIVDGIGTIHAYDTSNYERADISSRLGTIYKIRYDIYEWKFLVKFINNFLSSLTPFVYYALGGYLALTGHLDIGQLVAVIGAYKDLPGPLKDLIDWDQARQDTEIKYQQVVSQFAVEDVMDPALQSTDAKWSETTPAPTLSAMNLSVVNDTGGTNLENVSITIGPGETVALLGATGAGADTFVEVLGRLIWPTSGRVLLGDANILSIPEAVSGRAITYAASETHFFPGSLLDNLLYGLKNTPHPAAAEEGRHKRTAEQAEAARSGNPAVTQGAEWIDYAQLGVSGRDGLMQRVFDVLGDVQLIPDIEELGLRTTLTIPPTGEVAERVVATRRLLREALDKTGNSDLIEPFDPDRYNTQLSVLGNLLFGQMRHPSRAGELYAPDSRFILALKQQDLGAPLLAMGLAIARDVVELFGDLQSDHPYFADLGIMSADELPVYQALVQKLSRPDATPTDDERKALIRLAFAYVEPRYRFGLLTEDLTARIVAFRKVFHAEMSAEMNDEIDVYAPDRYLASATLLDNILFGRVNVELNDANERIRREVVTLLKGIGVHDELLRVGLNFSIGVGGRRLSGAQRQKLSLARALVRRSDYYVLNRPLQALDARTNGAIMQAALNRITPSGATVIWVVSVPRMAKMFARTIVFENGRVAEDGKTADILEKSGIPSSAITA